ncbi:MAG: TonB-dependent receptor [Flavobacteriaceae bacterium]|jgi:iron complex outermembrane receptor protein|nr:TonB-dependent receptor [Flavobacteriaceae bacterium]
MNNRIITLFSIFFLLFTKIGYSSSQTTFQQNPHTVRDTIIIDSVTVTGATRTETNLRNIPMTISVVGEKQIEGHQETSLLPVLVEEVPGFFATQRGILGYGVSTGSAGGMSVRGIGGSPTTGVLILIDGHPQYMGLMGHPLPDSYQSMMARRVEVVRGPASILYGSNAMGGVINIITKQQQKDTVQTNIRAAYGSYNTLSTELNNAVRSGKFNSFVSLNYNQSDGQREDMDFEQYSGYLKLGYDFTANWKSFVDLNLNRFFSSNPGTEKAPLIDNDASITRGMASLSIENKYEKTSGAVKFFYNFGHHKINDGYSPGGTPRNYQFKSDDQMLGITLYQSYNFFKGNTITGGFDFQELGGHAWNDFANGTETEIIDKKISDVAGYINFQQIVAEHLIFNAGIRVDNNSRTGTEWIPQGGISYIVSPQTVLKAVVGKGFRNPTIREMYMFPPQNPDLRPERLMNYELSLAQKLFNKAMDIEASVYYINGDNLIQTVVTKGKPLNINTGEIENYGAELSTRYHFTPSFMLSANYSWLHMRNIVLAAPEHKLYVGATYGQTRWNASTGIQYIDGLYTTVGNDPTKETYVLWNIRGSYKPVNRLEIFIKGENLLAQEYEINKGYPMPKATVFGGVKLSF